MANPDKPRGFIFAKTLDGQPAVATLRKLTVAARSESDAHGHIFIGDPIKMTNLGVVAVANSGDIIIGVCVGIGTSGDIDHGTPGMYVSNDLERRYLDDVTAGSIWVIPKENALFEIQSASDLDYTVGRSCDINVAAATAHGTLASGFSTCEVTTEANGDVTIVEIVDDPDNDSTLANTRYLVSIN